MIITSNFIDFAFYFNRPSSLYPNVILSLPLLKNPHNYYDLMVMLCNKLTNNMVYSLNTLVLIIYSDSDFV